MDGEKSLEKQVQKLLDYLLTYEDGTGLFRLSGPYWEVLYPVLKKYAPDLLQKYENYFPFEFDYFDEDVRTVVDTGDEYKNFMNALAYYNARIESFATPNHTHTVDLGDDEIIEYMPNQCL